MSLRSSFNTLRSAAMLWAVSWSSVRSNSTAAFALARRPDALSRGPMEKPRCHALIVSLIPETVFRAMMPGSLLFWSSTSPCLTKIRFAPVKGMTSATVPSATKERYFFMSICGLLSKYPWFLNSLRITTARLKATPTPARCLNGYWSPGRRGLITAKASGSEPSGGVW